jgi:hypothetical protein
MKFYKVLTRDLVHNTFQFKVGLNVDTIPFNPEFNCPGGFCYHRDGILVEMSKGVFIAEVIVPEDAVTVVQNYEVITVDIPDFFKSDKIILKEPRRISVDLVKELILEGAWRDDIILSLAISGGHYEVAEYLMSIGMKAFPLAMDLYRDRIPVPDPRRGVHLLNRGRNVPRQGS